MLDPGRHFRSRDQLHPADGVMRRIEERAGAARWAWCRVRDNRSCIRSLCTGQGYRAAFLRLIVRPQWCAASYRAGVHLDTMVRWRSAAFIAPICPIPSVSSKPTEGHDDDAAPRRSMAASRRCIGGARVVEQVGEERSVLPTVMSFLAVKTRKGGSHESKHF